MQLLVRQHCDVTLIGILPNCWDKEPLARVLLYFTPDPSLKEQGGLQGSANCKYFGREMKLLFLQSKY